MTTTIGWESELKLAAGKENVLSDTSTQQYELNEPINQRQA